MPYKTALSINLFLNFPNGRGIDAKNEREIKITTDDWQLTDYKI